METREIIYCLKKIVQPYVQNDLALQDFDGNTNFIKDLEINSAHLVDIVLDVEDEFNIAIDNDSMDKMVTVDDAVNIIKSKQEESDR
ncbi:phosphopantetheine-binding protein [Salinimicrobium gaetbulicola]|uniref:Phosphopantetheine-binding protein n=1 Tax=Salinimicrobium gaetbulicola TaxID=999702 RepID=A0ABW3ICE0_9FLAO